MMSFLPTNINIKQMKLNNLDHLGSVSFSSSVKRNRNVSAKKTQGFGQEFADETVKAFTHTYVLDDDSHDNSSEKRNP